MSVRKKVGNGLAVIAVATSLGTGVVKMLEGRTLESHLDSGGVPTICDGAIRNKDGTPVKLGQTKTDDECDELLHGNYGQALRHVYNKTEIELSPYQLAGLGSFTFNVGPGAYDKSTLLKLLNQGHVLAACDQLRRWTRIRVQSGSVRDMRDGVKDGMMDCKIKENKCYGLVTRREKEREMCLKVK